MRWYAVVLFFVLLPLGHAQAGDADVVSVKLKKNGDNRYRLTVTLLHKDEGWDHYADKWDVLAPDGTVLGTRTLYHPHVHEQPFTRSLSGVTISRGIHRVTIRAHDSVHAYGGKMITVDVPR